MRRATMGLAAQAFSSLTSFLLIIIPGRFLGLGEHGHLVFAVALAQIMLSLVRALCGETLLVLATRDDGHRRDESGALGAAVVAVSVGAVACLITAALWGEYRGALIAAALLGIPVCLLDVLRYCAIAEKRSKLLMASDALVFAGTTAGLVAVGRFSPSPAAFLAVWGLSCAITGALLCWRLGIGFAPLAEALRWLRANLSRGSAFVAESALGASSNVAMLAVMAIVTTSEEVSIFRTALTILGVTSLMNNFMRSTVLRELSPELLADRRRSMRAFVAMTGAVTAVIVVFGLCVRFAPLSLSTAVFGANFVAVLPAILPAIAHRACTSAATIPTIFLRAQGVTWKATRLRIAVVAGGLFLGPLGAYLAGARGALLGDALVYLVLFVGLTLLMARKPARD